MGTTAAFLLGWAQVVIYFPANVAALVDHFRYTVRQFIRSFPVDDCSCSCYSCCIDHVDQFLGSKAGGAFQSIMLVCKLIAPFAFASLFLVYSDKKE